MKNSNKKEQKNRKILGEVPFQFNLIQYLPTSLNQEIEQYKL